MADVSETKSYERITNMIIQTDDLDAILASYKKWADDYDKDMTFANHRGSITLADELEKIYPKEKRAGLRIFDIGAGTGRTGAELRGRGYTQIDALEPSQGMLDIARSHKLYGKLMCTVLTDKKLDIPEGTYDVVCSVGAIVKGHLPGVAIKEMFRLTKPGGIIGIVGAGSVWKDLPDYHVTMAGLIDDMEKEGKLRVLKKEFWEGYMFGGTASAIPGVKVIIRKS